MNPYSILLRPRGPSYSVITRGTTTCNKPWLHESSPRNFNYRTPRDSVKESYVFRKVCLEFLSRKKPQLWSSPNKDEGRATAGTTARAKPPLVFLFAAEVLLQSSWRGPVFWELLLSPLYPQGLSLLVLSGLIMFFGAASPFFDLILNGHQQSPPSSVPTAIKMVTLEFPEHPVPFGLNWSEC